MIIKIMKEDLCRNLKHNRGFIRQISCDHRKNYRIDVQLGGDIHFVIIKCYFKIEGINQARNVCDRSSTHKIISEFNDYYEIDLNCKCTLKQKLNCLKNLI